MNISELFVALIIAPVFWGILPVSMILWLLQKLLVPIGRRIKPQPALCIPGAMLYFVYPAIQLVGRHTLSFQELHVLESYDWLILTLPVAFIFASLAINGIGNQRLQDRIRAFHNVFALWIGCYSFTLWIFRGGWLQ